jgi:hypothetical protein
MKRIIRKVSALFWIFTVLSILFSLPVNAVHPVHSAPENITIDLANSGIHEIEKRLGGDLNRREKIGLKVSRKKLKKAVEKQNRKLKRNNRGKGCVTIILLNGDRMEVSIIRITESEVIYKPCGDRDAPESILSLAEVGLIQAEHGTEVYRTPGFTPPKSSRKLEGFGVAGAISTGLGLILTFSTGTLFFLLLLFIGFLLGIISLIRFALNKGKFRGIIFALLGMSVMILFYILLAIYG